MNRNIDDVEFTVFDTETTGLEPESGDRIVELAAIRFKGKDNIAVFQSLIDPHRPISEAAANVNRITPDMLQGAPGIDKVMPEFLSFIQGSCLCSYNAAFDLGFLHNELRLIRKDSQASLAQELDSTVIAVVDILKMAKRLLPNLERYALWFVAEKLGAKTQQEHRALSDTKLALQVFNRLNEILKEKSIFDFRNFLGLFSISSNLLNDINNQKLAKIQEAIDLKVNLKIKYLSTSKAQISQRLVLPKEIKQEKGRSYLVGHCALRNEERNFRIDGILHLEIV